MDRSPNREHHLLEAGTTCSRSQVSLTLLERKGKTDLILEGVLRVEQFLHQLSANIADNPTPALPDRRHSHFSVAAPPPASTFAGSPRTAPDVSIHSPQTPLSRVGHTNGFENAVLDSMHTSTTESVLQWPHFDVFPSLRTHHVSIFHLEQSRPALTIQPNVMFPYVTTEETGGILAAFEANVNLWYPTISQGQLQGMRTMLTYGAMAEDSVDACLTLLTMALGCAGQVTTGLVAGSELTEEEVARRQVKRRMGDSYFESALKKIHVAHLHVSSTATQCLFFVACVTFPQADTTWLD